MSPGGPRKLKPGTVRRVVATFQPYKTQAILTAVTVLVAVLLGLLPPWFLQIIIDQGLQKNDLRVVTVYSIWTIVATVAASALTLLYGYWSVLIGQRIMVDLRNSLFDHLQGMSLRFFTSTKTGEIQSRLISDVAGVQTAVSDAATNTLSNVALVVTTVAAMLWFDWRLTLLSVGVVPLFAIIGAKVGGWAQRIRRGTQEQTAELNALMQETLSVSGVLLTKTSGRRELVTQKFRRENARLAEWQIKGQVVNYVFFGLMRMIFSLVPALVYWAAGWLMARGDQSISVGVLVAFTALQARLFFPLTGLMSAQVEILSSMALFERIFDYLDLRQDITDRPGAVALEPSQVRGEVRFENVSFRYDDETDAHTLRGISFVAEPGQLVALVGPSGAGKTTLTYLIPRLYDVNDGSVTIDGIDVRDIRLESLGRLVGAVTQETYLVHTTIKENLRYAKPDATDEEIVEACKAAAIHDHIASLEQGYDTVVGERGYKLSGGEKQRIAIARAILKNPRILILDEATSALDTRSERVIQASLSRLMQGRTTFAIAHRLSTILAADQILVMDKGRIVERGRHEELLALGGLYSRLYHEQFEHEPERALDSRGETVETAALPASEPA
ncbi:MAG: ABC transporter ATP-binding protein/permease [Fimbriimonadales bacterium]|nr:ABC transporter ATP-binding protein/permease [Fimbriimonadales bacterium]